MPYVADNPESLAGIPSVGSGECVALVQQAAGAPVTRNWNKGALVKGNTAIKPGTAIATFDDAGKYANHRHGNHAAIYLGQDARGIQVIDQWNATDPVTHQRRPHPPSRRTISFNDKKGAQDNGNKFSVIQ